MENPKRLVRESYDAPTPCYADWAEAVRSAERRRYTELVLRELDAGSRVLDLGCDPGGSTTRALADRYRVVGVDLSWANVVRAKAALPRAQFVQADMTDVAFRTASFDGVVAFYSLIRVPRDEQPHVLAHVAEWLRPGGLFLLSLGVGDHQEDVEEDWLGGVPMFWSSYDRPKYRGLIEGAGFEVVSARDELAEEFGDQITFHWIVARRSTSKGTE